MSDQRRSPCTVDAADVDEVLALEEVVARRFVGALDDEDEDEEDEEEEEEEEEDEEDEDEEDMTA